MVITLVIDTFHINNNGTTISAMRFSKALLERGHTVRVVACGCPDNNSGEPESGIEMFYVPELVVPIASRLAHAQNTLFAKPVKEVLLRAISGADVVHIYQPWSLGRAAERIARKLHVPAIAAFHIQPENVTYNIGLGWFPPAAHLLYFLFYLTFYRRFAHIHCPSKFIAAQLRCHGYRARLHVISNGIDPAFCPGERVGKNTDEPYKILMVGRLSPEKRQDILIRAAMKSKHSNNIQLYFAGHGPREKRLRRMGRKLPLPPVFGYYSQGELIKLMQSCDLYVHASDVEIEGMSCMEAFSCGLVPIISDSSRSATRQFALCEAHLFRAGSSAYLADKIDKWIDNPQDLKDAEQSYANYAKFYSVERSIQRIERVYRMASKGKSPRHSYLWGRVYRFFSNLFYYLIALPVLFLWTRIVLGVRVEGKRRLLEFGGAMTVCNHVHMLDCALVALALFPRKLIFPTLQENTENFWYGNIVKLLGGVAVPRNMAELSQFLDEMEFLLLKGRVVHFFPEGELKPYDTALRDFKKGAFHLAAQARVPIIPLSISFKPPRGIKKLYRKKPTMVVHVGEPILPAAADPQKDLLIRMEQIQRQMSDDMAKAVSGE